MESVKTFRQSAFFLTRRCNLNCSFCKVPKLKKKDMPTEEVKGIFTTMKRIGFDINVLFGGEPMMRSDIYELIDFASAIELPYAFISNSTLINADSAKKLVAAGLNNYTASIDTLRYDDERSQAGLKALLMMKALGVKDLVANIVIHKDNLVDIPRITEHLLDLGVWVIFGIVQDTLDERWWEYRSSNKLGLRYAEIDKVKMVADRLKLMKISGRKIHNVSSYFDHFTTYGRRLNWKCTIPYYIPIDVDGSLMCCVDWRGRRMEDEQFRLHDLLDPVRQKQFVTTWMADTTECPGCYYNHSWQVEYMRDAEDLTHANRA